MHLWSQRDSNHQLANSPQVIYPQGQYHTTQGTVSLDSWIDRLKEMKAANHRKSISFRQSRTPARSEGRKEERWTILTHTEKGRKKRGEPPENDDSWCWNRRNRGERKKPRQKQQKRGKSVHYVRRTRKCDEREGKTDRQRRDREMLKYPPSFSLCDSYCWRSRQFLSSCRF